MIRLDNSTENVGGVSIAHAIPVDSFVKITTNYTRSTRSFTLNSVDGVIEIESVRSSSFVEENDGENCSITYQGSVLNLNKSKEAILDKLVKGSWILLHRDRNGNRVISGSKENPLFFSWKHDTGSSFAQSNSVSFTFKGSSGEASQIIDYSPI